MRLHVIACEALTRELGYFGAACPNTLDITWLRLSDETSPDSLRAALQREIDRIDREEPSSGVIALALGLCGGAVCGLTSRRHDLVLPRVHDCVSLLLGGASRYRSLFEEGRRVWLTPGRVEHAQALPAPGSQVSYVELPGVPYPGLRELARTMARKSGWELAEYVGDPRLLEDLLSGHWTEDRFLLLPPGRACEPSYHRDILRLKPEEPLDAAL